MSSLLLSVLLALHFDVRFICLFCCALFIYLSSVRREKAICVFVVRLPDFVHIQDFGCNVLVYTFVLFTRWSVWRKAQAKQSCGIISFSLAALHLEHNTAAKHFLFPLWHFIVLSSEPPCDLVVVVSLHNSGEFWFTLNSQPRRFPAPSPETSSGVVECGSAADFLISRYDVSGCCATAPRGKMATLSIG